MNIPDCCLQCPVLLSDPSLNRHGEGNPLKREQIDPMLLARNSRFIDVEPTRGGEVIVFGGADAGSKGGSDGPSRVGSFEILEEIGRGGMGIVYRARDTKLGRVVALKCPKREALAQPEFRRRFLNEAQSASKIMHPNITTVFEVFEEDDVPWLVMELVEGASLRAMLGAHDPLSCEEVLKHAEGLADALRVAHSCGVLHLDINPNNVLVGRDGRARLTDFGLARAWVDPTTDPNSSEASTNSHSSSSGVAGTRGYMSPEQALGKQVDPRSDLFSLGSVLYEMCTGRPAFYNPETGEWLDALLHREPEPISRVNHDMPIEFEEIVRKALAKRTFQRYQSANEMLLDLRAVRRKLESDSGYSVPEFDRDRRRWRRWITRAAVAVAIVAAGLVAKEVIAPSNAFPVLNPEHRRLTAGAGWDGLPAISPDGTMVAFSSNRAGNQDIWVVPIEGGQPLQITTGESLDTDPTWYPDKSAIAYESELGGVPSVWRVPPLGGAGAAVKLLDDAGDPAISPDGEWIAFTRADATGDTRIVVAPLDEPSRARILTGPDDGIWDHSNPAWSPDGRTICYASAKDLWLVRVDDGTPRRLTFSGTSDNFPTWSPDGRFIFYASFPDDDLTLWCLRISDGNARRLTSGASDESEPSLSRDGRWLVYSVSQTNPDVEVFDRLTGMRTRFPSGAVEEAPAIAADASAIAFSSDLRGSYDLWLQPLAAGHFEGPPRRLTRHPGSAAVAAFTPDGRWLAYHRIVKEQRDIWLVSADGGTPRQITDNPANEMHPAFSPDGSMMAFVSDRDGSDHVFVAPFDPRRGLGEATRLTTSDWSYVAPVWSPDGLRVACTGKGDGVGEVVVLDPTGTTEPVVLTRGAGAERVEWLPSGKELVVAGSWGGNRVTLRLVSLANGETRPFEPELDLGPVDPWAHTFATDASGRFVVYEVCERKGEIWMTETTIGRRWGVPWR